MICHVAAREKAAAVASDGCAARLLHADGAPPGQVAAHLLRVTPAADGWVLARLRQAAQAAMGTGAPQAAAGLLDRALAEPPPPGERAGVLREAARAQVTAGREQAFVLLEEALQLATTPPERAGIALEVAEAYAALFRWVDAVDVIERALAELGDADPELAARLEGELVVCGLHDARRAAHVAPVLAQLGSCRTEVASEPVAVAQAMMMLLAGRPAGEIAALLRRSGQRGASREPLARALELAARCGARPLAARARDELRAAGARLRRPWRTGVDALTPSELRVARLAADGRSNREIAGELYVTLKAVEGHLAHAYAKLGIEGRDQLPRALGRGKD